MTSGKQVQVLNVMNDAVEKLDFRDRVIKVALGFNNLVVATASQCYVYRSVPPPPHPIAVQCYVYRSVYRSVPAPQVSVCLYWSVHLPGIAQLNMLSAS